MLTRPSLACFSDLDPFGLTFSIALPHDVEDVVETVRTELHFAHRRGAAGERRLRPDRQHRRGRADQRRYFGF